MHPVERLRALLCTWREAQYLEHVATLSESADDEAVEDRRRSRAVTTRARLALGTGEAKQCLDEAVSFGLLDDDARRAFLWQLADAGHDELLHRRRTPEWPRLSTRLDPTTGTTLGHALARHLPLPAEARERLEHAESRIAPDRDEAESFHAAVLARGPGASVTVDAEAAFSARDEVLAEGLARCSRALELQTRDPRRIAVEVVRTRELDRLLPPGEAVRRMLAQLPGIAHPSWASRIRLHVHDIAADDALAFIGPHRVDLALPGFRAGMSLWRRQVASIARAAASIALGPARPIEHQHGPDEVALAVGTLASQQATRRDWLQRVVGDVPRLDAILAVLRTRQLIDERIALARVMHRRGHAHPELESLAIAGVEGVGSFGWLHSAQPTHSLVAHARAVVFGTLACEGLTERFDDDFVRNPRTLDAVRGIAARGAHLRLEDWCRELRTVPEEAAEATRRALNQLFDDRR